MKKIMLLMGALLLSLTSFAQTRTYMGAYTSDNYSESGLGLTSYPGTYSIIADIPTELLSAYDGAKVVGMRFAVSEPANTTKCFILKYDSIKEDTLAVAHISSSKAGWNEVMFDQPVDLNLTGLEGICMGYDYVQTSSNYPIAISGEGVICESYVYGNLGSGISYYNIGLSSYGNLCVQAIVEKVFDKYSVAAFDYEDIYTLVNQAGEAEITIQNTGSEIVNSICYTVSKNGTSSAEKKLTLTNGIDALVGSQTITIPVDAPTQVGEENLTVTITKVNDQPNTSKNNLASGKLICVKKLFKHRVAVEEYTGTGCGWCPRGMQGMENLREKFGDAFVGIALHQYSPSSRDAMAIASGNYKKLSFSGAPSCMIERGSEMDPYYGSGYGVWNDFEKVMKKIAPVGVEVCGKWSSDKKSVLAMANVESLANGSTYDIEYVLVADGLKGSSSTWKQSNYYYQYSASDVEDDLAQFAMGGTYGQSSFSGWEFNDVALASSYSGGSNKAKSLGTLTAYTPVESEYTVSMPTSALLVNAINYEKVYIIALVVDKATGKIVNAAKSRVGDETAIVGVNENENDDENENLKANAYNLSGQRVNGNYKGIVIKNGRKYLGK